VIVTTLAFTGFAAAIALAILKYRLYDIDRLINRTLVYGLLTTLLAGIYALAVLVLGQLFGGIGAKPPSWAVAGATLAVAALFQPARRRIQGVHCATERRGRPRHTIRGVADRGRSDNAANHRFLMAPAIGTGITREPGSRT
jgi:hypothetical protein